MHPFFIDDLELKSKTIYGKVTKIIIHTENSLTVSESNNRYSAKSSTSYNYEIWVEVTETGKEERINKRCDCPIPVKEGHYISAIYIKGKKSKKENDTCENKKRYEVYRLFKIYNNDTDTTLTFDSLDESKVANSLFKFHPNGFVTFICFIVFILSLSCVFYIYSGKAILFSIITIMSTYFLLNNLEYSKKSINIKDKKCLVPILIIALSYAILYDEYMFDVSILPSNYLGLILPFFIISMPIIIKKITLKRELFEKKWEEYNRKIVDSI